MGRVLDGAWGLGRVLLAISLSAVLAPGLAAARPQANKEYCFCVTPRNNQTASGLTKAGNPSKVMVRWRGTDHMDMPSAGDSATAILTRLRNMVAAANPGDMVGAVTTDPMTGRAVFCVKGPCTQTGFGFVSASESDCNFKECTFSRVSGPNDPFLRGVVCAFLAAEIPQGGNVEVNVLVQHPIGNPQTVSVQVPTIGPGNLNQRVVDALDAAGLDASLVLPQILIARGNYSQVDGVGVISNDLGLGTLGVAHLSIEAVPSMTGIAVALLVVLALVGGCLVLRKAC